MQFHGTADRYTLRGATAVATLLLRRRHGDGEPGGHAAHRRRVGRAGGGVHLRPRPLGRLHAPGQPRVGRAGARRPVRPDPLRRPLLRRRRADWVDLEQGRDPAGRRAAAAAGEPRSRTMNLDRTPLPRFWYLPRGEKAAVVHDGRRPRQRRHRGPVRPATRRRAPPAAPWPTGSASALDVLRLSEHADDGRPGGRATRPTASRSRLHVEHGLRRTTRRRRCESAFDDPARCSSPRPGRAVAPPTTNRTHCIAWSDWATQPKVELANGIRLDTNYYYWPGTWVQDRPGLFTGSGMPHALRRHGRLDDRRLPGDDADDRRVGHDDPDAHRRAARPRARARGLLRRVHGQHAHRHGGSRRAPTRSSRRRRRAACRSSRRARC